MYSTLIILHVHTSMFILQVIKREHRVSFVGISNWALDPAKMNRGVMVTRGDPDSQELVNTAKYAICIPCY